MFHDVQVKNNRCQSSLISILNSDIETSNARFVENYVNEGVSGFHSVSSNLEIKDTLVDNTDETALKTGEIGFFALYQGTELLITTTEGSSL